MKNIKLTKMYNNKLYMILLLMISIIFITGNMAVADDNYEYGYGQQDDKGIFSYDLGERDSGNELTGEAAAWILGIANITVVISLLFKGIVKFTPLRTSLKEKIKSLNKFQKKYLMLFHYILNPIALIIAFVHFLLSQSLASFLPALGLVLMTIIGVAGMFIKFKITPKRIRNAVYWLHTNPMPLGFVLIILFLGHTIFD